jgi:Amt family ammonium transporter
MRLRIRWFTPAWILASTGWSTAVYAQGGGEPSKLDTGDTAFVLLSAALVMLMTPGLALFYGGMVRRKNALATIMQSFICLGLVGVAWVIYGYSLAFGPDKGGLIGGLEWVGLRNVGLDPNPDYAATIPHQAFMIYQAMFAVITPALITGAFAERMKFKTYVVFVMLWFTLVYVPVAHWVWGAGGWLRTLGALDFAGGTVVHISSGVSALVAAIVIGRRLRYPSDDMRPHDLTMTLLGTGLLWFGWFGFNAGSALSASTLSVVAFVATNTAAAAGALAWMFVEWWDRGEPNVLGAASGAVAGLVGITPAAGFVSPISAVLIGAGAGALCYGAVVKLRPKLGYDDSLDTFGIHGVGGIWGALATGLFASKLVNAAGNDGLLAGNPAQLAVQLAGVAATVAYAALITLVLFKVLDATMGLRVKEQEEEEGLDLSEHGEVAYDQL